MRARVLVPCCAVFALALTLAACSPAPPPGRGPNPVLASTKLVGGLHNPWDIAFTPGGQWMLFTQRNGIAGRGHMASGGISVLGAAAFGQIPGTGQPPFQGNGEGGLLGMAIDPQWPTRNFVYLCMDDHGRRATGSLHREHVVPRRERPSSPVPLVTGIPVNPSGRHSGCRPRFQPGTMRLFVGTGDAAMGGNSQSTATLGGKVLCVSADAPNMGCGLPGMTGTNTQIYSYGHRNVQGIAFNPTNGLGYSVEHGPSRDDEVNLIGTGDYGWHPPPGPYNENVPMTAFGSKPAIWTSGPSTIAPSGMTILSGAQWKAWNGALAMAVLKNKELRVLFVDGSGTVVVGQTWAVRSGLRLRTAVQGPDGNLYISTDAVSGGDSIWRLVPR